MSKKIKFKRQLINWWQTPSTKQPQRMKMFTKEIHKRDWKTQKTYNLPSCQRNTTGGQWSRWWNSRAWSSPPPTNNKKYIYKWNNSRRTSKHCRSETSERARKSPYNQGKGGGGGWWRAVVGERREIRMWPVSQGGREMWEGKGSCTLWSPSTGGETSLEPGGA